MQSEHKSDPINRGYKNKIHNKVQMQIKRISWIMQLSQLLRFYHDWYCCLNRGPKHRDLLRWVAISYELLRSVTIREKMPVPINYMTMRMTRDRIRYDTSKSDESRLATLLSRMLTIYYEFSIHETNRTR